MVPALPQIHFLPRFHFPEVLHVFHCSTARAEIVSIVPFQIEFDFDAMRPLYFGLT